MAKGTKTVEGEGDNLQDAIDDAIAKAIKTIKKTDAMIKWTLLEVTGTSGGIASLNTVVAKISYSG